MLSVEPDHQSGSLGDELRKDRKENRMADKLKTNKVKERDERWREEHEIEMTKGRTEQTEKQGETEEKRVQRD